MKLFSRQSTKLETENRILTEAARQRARRVEELESRLTVQERECQTAREAARVLQLERDFYSKRACEFEEHNRQVTDSASEYSFRAQQLERELVKLGTEYTERNRRLTERVQELERELAALRAGSDTGAG